ncbi:MAG: FAD-dependent oxidoreductase [Planctomycetota bacterium]|jgi:heterodisulfide reductase subunit A-like polyferredoxin
MDMDNERKQNGKVGSVMVVGAGIGGMQAALDLANAGFHVTLVEETTAIGGRMAQLDKTFPTNDCSMCTISPKLIEVDKHLNVDVVTNADVVGLEGEAGNFRVTVRKRPRYVDLDKCNSCGDCIEKCPVEVPSEFDEGTTGRKAIFKRYPQAIPGAMAISKTDRPPCVLNCPAHVNCQGYVALVGDGRFAEAYDLIRERNPFPSTCGRICHHPCESQCNRRDLDDSVAVNNLKRFTTDWVARKRAEGEEVAPPPKGEIDPNKPPIAVVGGGPAGMTAARDLALKGYPVTLFEAHEKLGGAVLLGVPGYRLPEEMLQRDVDDVVAAGFEVKTGARLGRDFTLESLNSDGFRAVFLSIGCTRPATLTRSTDGSEMKGTGLEGVLLGLDFLRDVKLGRGPKLDGKVVVVGGGNVAIDVAMTARRQGAEAVELVCLESREEMPAYEWEIRDAAEEGVVLNPAWGPKEIVGSGGKASGLKLQRCTSVFDEQGRFAPTFDGEVSEIDADCVIIAIGQRSDFSFLSEDDPLWDPSKRFIHADKLTLQTNVDWIFAGGDMATGPKSVVEAVAQGHEAAESIDRFVRGDDLAAGRQLPEPTPAPMPEREFSIMPRAVPSRLPLGDRAGYVEIEQTLDEQAAITEAKRCLACGVCSECLQCVTACSAGAILHDMVPEEVALDVGAVLLAPGFEPFDPLRRGEYGYGEYPNVITSLEFERILSASGPYQGHVLRPSDRTEPKRVAWIQCVGSRDVQSGNDYCSSVCCMYAVKEAIMAVDHVPGLEATIFYNDIRAYGKGFETYYEGSKKNYGVEYKRGIISTVKQKQKTKNLALTYVAENGEVSEEEFDLVVLSIGLRPSGSTTRLAETVGVELDRFGFCRSEAFDPGRTSKDGVFVAGAFAAPMDIPETVMTASGAAAMAGEILQEVRGTRIREKKYPEERDSSGEEPRVGVFVCRCGTNISRVVGVSDVVEYAKALPNVIYSEENLYTCSTDTQTKITDTIIEHNLNRVVVASCTPRTHEPLFQETLREAGLNKHLFEMANIRDQCSWVHFNEPDRATLKAKDLVRMAVARAATLRPFDDVLLEVDQRAIVLGAGVAGMTAAVSLADQGFQVSLVEREPELGGIARKILHTLDGENPQALLADLVRRVKESPLVSLYTDAVVEDFSGHVGKFKATLRQGDQTIEIGGGAVIVAVGGAAYEPSEYGYAQSESIVTQLELEARLADPHFAKGLKSVVMIQCVGSREEEHPYCSRVCCQEAVKNSLAIKEANPQAQVYVLFRDVRTYGFDEIHYQRAREAGVTFLRFDPDDKPQVSTDGGLRVTVTDDVLGRPVELTPDLLVLSAGIRPHGQSEAVSRALKVPLNADGFFLEAHMKLRPLDFGSDGVFLAGLAHAPKSMAESISQAKGAAARAATVISKPLMHRSGVISDVDPTQCAACLTCVRLCPYDVPAINEEGVAYIEPASCQGCGVCASACPRKAIVTRHYRDDQIISKIDVLFGDPQFEAQVAVEAGEEA